MTKDAIQMVFLGALVILSFCSAKVTPTSHDMRMEDFEICRKEWNKKSTKFPLKFSPGGEVLKLSNKSEQSQQRYLKRYQICSALSDRYIFIMSLVRWPGEKVPAHIECLVNGLCRPQDV